MKIEILQLPTDTMDSLIVGKKVNYNQRNFGFFSIFFLHFFLKTIWRLSSQENSDESNELMVYYILDCGPL